MAEPFAVTNDPEPERFELSAKTDAEFTDGDWRTLPCGLDVRLAPSGTTASDKVRARLIKKYGKPPKRSMEDIPPEKQRVFTIDLVAEANFLEFRDPKTKDPMVLINDEDRDGRKVEQRKYVLGNLPTVASEINEALTVLQEEMAAETEETEKN